MSVRVQTNQALILPDADYNVTEADTGKIFLIPNITGTRTLNLPALYPGLHYIFINRNLVANDLRITGGAASMTGVLINEGDNPTSAAGSRVNFIGTSLPGDCVELYCTGIH